MKVDPNLAIGMVEERVLCEGGGVALHDGGRSPKGELGDPGGPFLRFCESLDPNRCFIGALIPDDADRDVFFEAREVARAAGLHMQATVDTPERHRATWQSYVASKRAPSAEPDTPPPDSADGG